MRHQVPLRHLGDVGGLGLQVIGGHQLGRVPVGQARGAERPRPAAGSGHLEDGGLRLASHEGDAGGAPPGRSAGAGAAHLITFSKAAT